MRIHEHYILAQREKRSEHPPCPRVATAGRDWEIPEGDEYETYNADFRGSDCARRGLDCCAVARKRRWLRQRRCRRWRRWQHSDGQPALVRRTGHHSPHHARNEGRTRPEVDPVAVDRTGPDEPADAGRATDQEPADP